MLIINIKESWLLGVFLLAAHVGAFAAGLVGSLGTWITLLLGTTLALSLWQNVALHALRRVNHAVLRLQLDRDGDCVLVRRDGETVAPCRLRSWYTSPCLVVLQLRCPRRWWPLNLVLAVDALGPGDFHALRATLGMRRLAV